MLNAVKKMLLQSISLRHPQDERSTRENLQRYHVFKRLGLPLPDGELSSTVSPMNHILH
jgi:hypothetical protein